MTSSNIRLLHHKRQSASCVLLVVILFLTLTGCQAAEQTTEPLLRAVSAYNCDVMQGFSNPSSSADTDSVKAKISDIKKQIYNLEQSIVSRQNELTALQNTEKSEELQRLEQAIAALQEQISSLQSELKELQRELNESSNINQSLVGYIEYLKIGNTELVGDITVTDPVSSSQSNVVGVVSGIYWDGGYTEPISFSCQVSDKNKSQLQALTQSIRR